MDVVVKALRLKDELDRLRPITPEQEARILQKFRLDWNYHSNHLEGNSLTYGETKSLLLHGITAQGKPLKDHLEITGHNEAIDWVIEIVRGDRPLTESFIRELHKLLLQEPYEVEAITPDGKPTRRMIQVGQYKTVPNHVKTVTGAIHYFASPEETPAKMEELMDWYRGKKDNPSENPIFLAALFHHRFISIHPFDDGNGRTGRLLMNFILMQHGYPPVIIKSEDKQNYYRALQQADGGNHDAFVEYMSVNLVRSLEIMLAGARGASIEEPDDLDKELALLEHRLKGAGKKATVRKSKEAVDKVWNESVLPLARRLVEVQKKFSHFYFNFSASINVANGSRIDLTAPSSLEMGLRGNEAYEATIQVYLQAFRQIEFDRLHFGSNCKFRFNEAFWELFPEGDEQQAIKRTYDQQLSENEMTELAQNEGKRHLKMIQEKMQQRPE